MEFKAQNRSRRVNPQIVSLILIYITSRLLGYALGIRFATNEVSTYWQFLDVDLLKHHLLQSVLYLHAQPPLMNFFFGLSMKLFPLSWPIVDYLLYCTVGLLAWLAIFDITVRNGLKPGIALLYISLAMCNPSAILFEAQPLYTHLTFCLLAFSAFFFDCYLEHRSAISATAFLACLALLIFFRASFQFFWFLPLALWVLCLAPRVRLYRILLVISAYTLLIIGLYLKNGLLVDSFSSSSWIGMNLAKAWASNDSVQIQSLIADHKISAISGVPPFEPLNKYDSMIAPLRPIGVTAVDSSVKNNGTTNFNNRTYIVISKAYLKDYVGALKGDPRAFVSFWLHGWTAYFEPTSEYAANHDPDNEKLLEPLDRVYRGIFCCCFTRFDPLTKSERPTRKSALHVLSSLCIETVVVTLFLVLLLVCPALLRWASSQSSNTQMLLIYVSTNVLFFALLNNFVEAGENMRFRYETHGLVLIAIAIVLGKSFHSIQQLRLKQVPPDSAHFSHR